MFTKVRKNCSFYVELVKNSAVYFQDTCLCSLDCVDVQMCINVLTLSLACWSYDFVHFCQCEEISINDRKNKNVLICVNFLCAIFMNI